MTDKDEEDLFATLDPKTLDPSVAKVIFATEWDDAIEFFRAVAYSCGMTQEEWIAMIDKDKQWLETHVRLPKPMTLATSKPFVELSDMLTLARVARYCFEHVDEIGIALT